MTKHNPSPPGPGEKGLLQYFVLDWIWLICGAVFCFELASVLMVGWPDGLIPAIRYPYAYRGDSLFFHWMAQRAIEGWYFTNERSGFPFGSAMYDFPNSDAGSFLIYKVLGGLTGSVFSTVDLYFLLSFPVIFVVTFLVLRSFGIRKANCFMAAILFCFAPFHFSRLFYGHDLYVWYFVVPLFFYYGRNLFFYGQTHWGITKPARLACLLLVTLLLSSFGVYYAFFGSIVLLICGSAASYKGSTLRPLRNALLFCALIFSGCVLNLLPSIVYRQTHGINHEVAQRVPVQTEVYSLKIMTLLLPQPDHRVEALKSYAEMYRANFPLSNTTASLGIFGIVGFLAILLSLVAGYVHRPVGPLFGMTAMVVVFLLLISTVGGFNVLFATLVTPLIRGWNRISIFIQFGSILAFALLLDGWVRLQRSRLATSLCAAAATLVGLWDQTPASYRQATAAGFEIASMDEGFIHQVEASMPPGSAIYQLPYMEFPDFGPVEKLEGYAMATGFTNSKTLRWSFGGMQGREGDLFYRALAKKTVAEQVSAIEQLGFSGVYIDRRGFADRGVSIINDFTQVLGFDPVLERSDGNVVFFKLSR